MFVSLNSFVSETTIRQTTGIRQFLYILLNRFRKLIIMPKKSTLEKTIKEEAEKRLYTEFEIARTFNRWLILNIMKDGEQRNPKMIMKAVREKGSKVARTTMLAVLERLVSDDLIYHNKDLNIYKSTTRTFLDMNSTTILKILKNDKTILGESLIDRLEGKILPSEIEEVIDLLMGQELIKAEWDDELNDNLITYIGD